MKLDEIIQDYEERLETGVRQNQSWDHYEEILTLAQEIKAIKERLDEFMLEFSDAR